MSQSIREAVPKLLKTLWELENELRSAAQSSVVLRRDDAKRHLSDARRHLDAVLALAQHARPEERAQQDHRVSSEDPRHPSSIKE
jgi:hypothetical protein